MARVFDLDLQGVTLPTASRDFAGAKFGADQRQFSVVIEDQALIDQLLKDGVRLYIPQNDNPDEPPRAYLTVKVSYRFGEPDIAVITPEGEATVLTEQNVHRLNKAWIKNVELHIHGSSYERLGKTGVTVYLDTMVVWLMSQEEQDALMEENKNRSNPVKEKYKNIFGV